MTYTIAPLVWDEHDNAMTPFGEVHVERRVENEGEPRPSVYWEGQWSETGDPLGDDVIGNTRDEARSVVAAWNERKMLTGLVPACDVIVADVAAVEPDGNELQENIRLYRADDPMQTCVFVDSRGVFLDDLTGSHLIHAGRPTRSQFWAECDAMRIEVPGRKKK